MRKRFDARSRSFGLTRAQWQALAYLRRQEGINQSGLAEALDLEPITVGRLIDRMEEAGWVERRADAADRRVHRLHMTERARPMVAHLEAIADDLTEEAFAGLPRSDRDRIMELLSRIRVNLSEHSMRPDELVETIT